MSTLSEHTGNGNPPATRLQREETKAQLDGLLQQFDVLPSRFDQFLFKYIYIYMIGLFFLAELPNFIFSLSMSSQVGEVLLQQVAIIVPPTLVTILVIWRFNAWRWRTPHTLRDLIENKRITIPDGDADASYLHFLEHYRQALASPKRYFLSGFLMFVICLPFAYYIALNLSSGAPTIFVAVGVVVNLLFGFLYLGAFYCTGILTWAMFISGWYIRKLVRAFQLNIQPFHPDECGGLRLLGNFCFGLGSVPLIGSGLLIGYSIFALLTYSPAIYPNSVAYLVLFVYFPLLSALLFGVPEIVFNFILPLRDIHNKMVSEGKINEHRYFTRTEALREEIQALLAVNQVEAARAIQEKRTLLETLYAPYPTWPFHVRSKISRTVLELGGSLLLGLITAAIVQYSLPAIIIFFIHTP
jgi:hypothetical protein